MDRRFTIAFAVTSLAALSFAFPSTRSSSSTLAAAAAADVKFTGEVLPAGTKLVVGTATTRNLIVVKSGKADAVSNGIETVTTNCTATVVQSERSIDRLRIDFGSCPYTT